MILQIERTRFDKSSTHWDVGFKVTDMSTLHEYFVPVTVYKNQLKNGETEGHVMSIAAKSLPNTIGMIYGFEATKEIPDFFDTIGDMNLKDTN